MKKHQVVAIIAGGVLILVAAMPVLSCLSKGYTFAGRALQQASLHLTIAAAIAAIIIVCAFMFGPKE